MRSRRALCLAAFLFAIPRPLPAEVVVQTNSTWNGECSLVADPHDPSHLVVAWMKLGIGRISIAASVSTNFGQTWSVPSQMPHHDALWTSADPTLAFGLDGSVYLAYVDFDARHGTTGGAVLASRSQDGGRTWGPVSLALTTTSEPDRPVDRPWLAVDCTPGPQSGRVYLESKSLVDTTNTVRHVWMVSSDDHAATWSAPHRVDAPIPAGLIPAMGTPSVAADGALWVLYLSFDSSLSSSPRFIAAVSHDAGVNFQPHVLTELPANAFLQADSLYQFDYHLAAHPQDPQLLVAVWTDARLGDADIFTSRTVDGGTSWSAPRRLNDDPEQNGAGQDMVWAGFAPNGGYAAGWRDRRLGGAGDGAPFDIYAAYSADGGRSFAPNVRVNTISSPPITMPTGVDFIGVAVEDTLVHAAWTSAVSSPYSLHAGSASVAVYATDVSLATDSRMRVLSAGNSGIRLRFERTPEPGDRFVICDVAGRKWSTRAVPAAGGVILRFLRPPPSGVYLVEWRSRDARVASKAVLIH